MNSCCKPIEFEEYFDLGEEETLSPFIKSESRSWGENLTLKGSLLATVFLVIAFLLSFSTHTTSLSHLFLVGVYFLAGIPALIESVEELASFEINIDILMTLAAFSSVLIGSGMEGGLLLVLFALSGSMEDSVTSKAKGAISSLKKLSPTTAIVVLPDGVLIERAINDITVGTTILIRAGQVVPLDGTVVEGISSVNLVHLTGESMPVLKKKGDSVPAGARNLEGTLTVSVSHTSADSTLSKIIQLVTQAQEEKPILQRWFDRLSKGYAITIICLAALFALTFPFLFQIPFLGVEGAVYRALAFLIAASPCALIIAIPIAYLSAVGACAKQGILLKGGVTLDAFASCSILAFDKTGTLTSGVLHVEGIEGLEEASTEQLDEALAVAYALEKNAVHPIAQAIVSYAQEKKASHVAIENFSSIPGYGLKGTFEKKEVFIGRPEYFFTELPSKIVEAKNKGELVAVLIIEDRFYIFRFLDTLRPNIENTIRELNAKKLRLVMLTGDHKTSAQRIANTVGIKEYLADLTPEQKLEYVSQTSADVGLAMVGDGVNDAPALARATVGICMGKVGSTPAIDASDVILLHDNIEHLGWFWEKSRKTQKIVRQNLALASCAIVVASLPALIGWIPLWLAVVMHEGGTVIVGLNGLRLLKK